MAPLDASAAELLDRDLALREIDALIAEARARAEALAIRVCGPPGIGKTAVLTAAAAPFGDHARAVAAEPTMRHSPGSVARALLGVSFETAMDPQALTVAVRALTKRHDVFVVDDLQWVDEVSLRILRSTLDGEDPIAVIFGDRREDAPELRSHQTIALQPLRRTSAIELITRRYPAVPRTVADSIADASSGLPFAIVVLSDDAANHGVVRAADAPASVGVVVAGRLARASKRGRDLARYIALLDPPVELNLVARALDITLEATATALLEFDDLVIVEGVYASFRHESLRDAVAATVRDKITAYTKLLQGCDPVVDDAAGLATMVRCALGCGDNAVTSSASLRLSRVLAAAGSLGSALQSMETALHGMRGNIAPAFSIEYAGILEQLGQDEKAASFLRQALRAAIDRNDASAAGELIVSLAGAAVALERFTEVDGFCERVAALPTCNESVTTRIRTARLIALAYSGRFEEYLGHIRAAPATWNDRRTLAFVHAVIGDAPAAVEDLSWYATGLRKEHDRQHPVDRILEVSVALLDIGPRALDRLDDLPVSDTRHASEWALRAFSRVADGRWGEARDVLRSSEASYDEAPHQLLEVRLLLAALARDSAMARDSVRALRTMIASRRVRHAIAAARWYVIASGPMSPSDIEAFVAGTLNRQPMPYQYTSLPLAIALLADNFGVERCRAALDAAPRYGSRWHRAHHELAYGLLRADNERLRAARDAFDSLGAGAFATIAGIALPVARARDLAFARRLGLLESGPAKPVALTRREREVAELTARGASNREIGAVLGIADRTVETHLTSIFAKLGISSRSALAARMLAPGP